MQSSTPPNFDAETPQGRESEHLGSPDKRQYRVRKSGAAQATAAEDHFHDAEAIGRAPFENVKFPLPNPAPQWRGARVSRESGSPAPYSRKLAQASGAWLRSVRDASPVPNSETLPTTVEVTSMAPSATPTRTGVRIYTRCRIHSRCRIDRVVFNHHSRRRYNDGAANHEGLGNDGSRLLDNNRRRSPVLVRPRIAFAVASYRQIGGHCRGGKS